ncbi:MAG: type II toxin-antitoxin system VapC family toxin [Acidimicrobiales bacterium]
MVPDASALVAALTDDGPDGQWAAAVLRSAHLSAPALLPYEAANVIRRLALAKRVGADVASQAHRDLLDLAVDLWPYGVTSARAWEFRSNLSIYDASYVAVAEAAGASLVTLDAALAKAPGVACPVLLPPLTTAPG